MPKGLTGYLQDSFVVKGRHASVGYVEYLRQPIPEGESALVKLLLDAGAILYCKTNIPQTMMVSSIPMITTQPSSYVCRSHCNSADGRLGE